MKIAVTKKGSKQFVPVLVRKGNSEHFLLATEPEEERRYLDNLLGRGPGDPDAYGYPGQEAADVE